MPRYVLCVQYCISHAGLLFCFALFSSLGLQCLPLLYILRLSWVVQLRVTVSGWIFFLLSVLASSPSLPGPQKEISCTKDQLTSDGKGKTELTQESFFSIWYTNLVAWMKLKNKQRNTQPISQDLLWNP